MTAKALFVCSLTFAVAAHAQDELGLDFSEAKTPAEFRPSIGFIGVTPSEATDPLPGRAKALEAEFIKMLNEAEKFSVVKLPVDAASASMTARKCLDFDCLQQLAEKMGVHRLITCTLTRSGPGTVLTINGFDPTLPAVLPATVESQEKEEKAKMGGFAGIAGKSQAQRDKDFIAKTKGPFNEMIKALATPLGKISIDVIEQSAVTKWKGKELGTGSFEKTMPVGSYDLEVSSDEYLPFDATVAVEPMKTAEVKVTLVAKPMERRKEPVVVVEPAPVFYKRPGLYVALAGAIVMGLGLTFGGLAKQTEQRAIDADRDGVLDITRSQAKTAKTQALLASILVPVGAVALGAGVVWAIIVPLIRGGGPSSSGPSGPSGPGDPEGSGFGFMAGMGGTF